MAIVVVVTSFEEIVVILSSNEVVDVLTMCFVTGEILKRAAPVLKR